MKLNFIQKLNIIIYFGNILESNIQNTFKI